MSFNDCMRSAVEQGVIDREQAAEITRIYREKFEQARQSMPEGEAARFAKEGLEAEQRATAAEARRRVLLQDSARERLAEYLQDFRDGSGNADIFEAVLAKFEHYGTGGTTSVSGRAKAIISLAHGELADVMRTFRRSRLTGGRFARPEAEAMVRELFGQGTGDASAKALAGPVREVFEKLRQRFNAAGGAIGKLDNYGLPQAHDATAMLRAAKKAPEARQKWVDFIRPLLDVDRMRDPLTGESLSAARLDEVLHQIWGNIATDGINRIKPSTQRHGAGALASQRADHRFLHFKDADSWLAYAREFGEPDPVRAIFNHINGMARDIAAMEELGPNPSAMVEWMKQVAQREASQALEGKPSLYKAGSKSLEKVRDNLNYIPWRIDAVWNGTRGAGSVSRRWAAGVSNLRNVLTSAQLGAASLLAAPTDPVFDMAARYLSGLPITKAMAGILKTFSAGTRDKAARAGLMVDDFVHTMQDGARWAGFLGGSEWSKWLVDRTMNWSMLEPMTQARRHVFGLDYMAAMADEADKPFAAVNPTMKRWMEGYGLTSADWDIIRATPQHGRTRGVAGMIRPSDVAQMEGGGEAAERMLMMILGQTERAVPSGTIRASSFVTGAAQRGTFGGELLDSFLQYKSFGLSLTTLQLQAIGMELGMSRARGIGYGVTLAVLGTLAGSMAVQLRHMSQGRDPQPMDDANFWLAAGAAGGGFGIFGDFLFADTSRFDHSMTETLAGPTVGFLTDTFKLATGSLQQAARGDEEARDKALVRAGTSTANYIGRYTPVASSLWYERLAFRRLFVDQLHYLADPAAHRKFRNQEKKLEREMRQGFWWRPGQTGPDRMPEMSEQ